MQTVCEIHPGAFVLASILSGYPDSDYLLVVQKMLDDQGIEVPEKLKETLFQMIHQRELVLEELSSEYLSIFDLSKNLNPLYETEYGRERAMFKTNELVDIAGFYKAFGFELDVDGNKEMLDHVSVELEFYALMIMKLLYLQEQNDTEGVEIVSDGMRKFMNDHLGRFISSILSRPGVIDSTYYSLVFGWIHDLVQAECSRLNISPDQATWLSSQSEPEEVCCSVLAPKV